MRFNHALNSFIIYCLNTCHSYILGGLQSLYNMRCLLLGLDVQRLLAIHFHLLLPHLPLNDAYFPGKLGRLLLLGLDLVLDVLSATKLEYK